MRKETSGVGTEEAEEREIMMCEVRRGISRVGEEMGEPVLLWYKSLRGGTWGVWGGGDRGVGYEALGEDMKESVWVQGWRN